MFTIRGGSDLEVRVFDLQKKCFNFVGRISFCLALFFSLIMDFDYTNIWHVLKFNVCFQMLLIMLSDLT